MKKKKKGSSFVIVVLIMAILFTLGTSVLTVTASDYKMRINESNKLKNLYAADSGLDIVKEIIIKTSQQAINYADKEVKNQLSSLTDKSEENLNRLFKEKYMEFLNKETNETDGETNERILSYLITKRKYIENIDNAGRFTYSQPQTDALIEIDNIDGDGYVVNADSHSIKIKVKSTFETKDGELKNKKTIETKFTITAPDYKDIADVSVIDIYPVFSGKIITADGNLDIKGEAEIKGDIWIKGNENVITDNNPAFTFNKYNGGISIKDSSLNLSGNIFTASNLSLKDNATVEITGDVYALNAYVGKSATDISSSGNKLDITNNLVVNNDLALNAKKSSINIGNDFYGINDKTESSVTTAKKALQSSSIIVNEIDGSSSITVNNDSYIMGVAYIDATDINGNKYQTGESVAVKGNYLAYTTILDGYEDKVTLKYYNPLHLIDSIDGDSSLQKKSEYFKEYYKQNHVELKNGGVNLGRNRLGKVYSVGAYIKGNTVGTASITNVENDIVLDKRKDFANNVFSMGDKTGVDKDLSEIYISGNVVKTVDNQINFTEVKNIPNDHQFNKEHGRVFLSTDKNIEIGKNYVKIDDIIYNFTDEELNKMNGISALVITGGDVTIKGEVKFNGNIIAKGNVTLEESGEKILTYDDKLTKNIISDNYDVLEKVFKTDDSKPISSQVTVNNVSSEYDVDKYLDTHNWKIIK